MQPLPLSVSARQLVARLKAAEHQAAPTNHVFHVASLGAGFYFAYEQLRNAAAYREHHLLLRSAIERFLVRDVNLRRYEPMAADLVTELTQAGYLKNDSVPLTQIERIDAVLAHYATLYHTLTVGKRLDPHLSSKWLFQYASVHIENLLTPNPGVAVFMQYAYEHYLASIDSKAAEHIPPTDQTYRIALYCAVQRSIFKSNLATIRYYCITASLGELEQQSPEHIIQLNELIDELYQAPLTNRLSRLVTRYGAPMRILREYILGSKDAVQTLEAPRSETLSRVKTICAQQYVLVKDQLNARVAKTILFILITKTLIGISVEVPYDLAIYATISWLPLIVNIGFPLLYMATIGVRIQTPSRQNTEVVTNFVDRILYEDAGAPVVYKPKRRIKSKSLNGAFTFIYAIGFIGSIALVVLALNKLGFNLVNGVIFFVFFSAVSFLGFRLRQSAHELEMIDERQGILQTLIDFLSTPFVRVGHWLSDKYAKANIVTFVLDLAIEMPLKTSLRTVRQWVSFMRDKQDEL
jgi:hypothetical protein